MNMMEQIWKVRDSRGLDSYDKVFLMTVASRGEAGCFCEWKRNSEDMGMKKDRYYKSRTSLVEKGLLVAEEQPYGPTIYKISNTGLNEWHATHSVTQNDDSVTQNDLSATQNGRSVRPERKKNTKKNYKNNNEEEQDAPAGADTSSLSLNDKNIKEDQETTGPAARPADSLNSPIEPVVLNECNDLGHSVTQNEETDTERFLRMREEWRKKDAERAARAKEPVVHGGLEW